MTIEEEPKPIEYEHDPTVRLKPDEVVERLREANEKLGQLEQVLEGHIQYVDYFTDEEKKNLIAEVEFAASILLAKLGNCGVGRELLLAEDRIREALFWVNRHMYKE